MAVPKLGPWIFNIDPIHTGPYQTMSGSGYKGFQYFDAESGLWGVMAEAPNLCEKHGQPWTRPVRWRGLDYTITYEPIRKDAVITSSAVAPSGLYRLK